MPKHKLKKGFFIKNILIIGEGEQWSGIISEFDEHPLIFDDGRTDLTRASKIIEQVQAIAEYAVSQHNVNRLTRVVTNEFSFYTRSTPLTLDEYKFIINILFNKLKTLPPNIILIISSMPVLWSDKVLRNAILHIQSPNNAQSSPIIHHFSKETVSDLDLLYNDISSNQNTNLIDIHPYKISNDDYFDIHSPNISLSDSCVMHDDSNQYKSAILVQGNNLPPIIDTIDICSDHTEWVAWNNAKELLIQLIKLKKNSAPVHISHIVSSNTKTIIEDHLVASPVHADHCHKNVGSTTLKKFENVKTFFGRQRTAYVYHQSQAELMHSIHFLSATTYMKESLFLYIEFLSDNYNNTLLHQVFIKNKTSSPNPTLLRKRFDQVIPHFKGHSINQQNKDGNTALHLAVLTVSNTDTDMLLKLLNNGSKLDIKNKDDLIAVQYAYENDKAQLMINFFTCLINQLIPIPPKVYKMIKLLESKRGLLADKHFLTLLDSIKPKKDYSNENRSLFQDNVLFANRENQTPRFTQSNLAIKCHTDFDLN